MCDSLLILPQPPNPPVSPPTTERTATAADHIVRSQSPEPHATAEALIKQNR